MRIIKLRDDANIDGTVDTNIFAWNYGNSNTQRDEGRFNYDGETDTVDFSCLAGTSASLVSHVPG